MPMVPSAAPAAFARRDIDGDQPAKEAGQSANGGPEDNHRQNISSNLCGDQSIRAKPAVFSRLINPAITLRLRGKKRSESMPAMMVPAMPAIALTPIIPDASRVE